MKKLIISLILAILLNATFVTPAFADDGNGNMPGKAADLGYWLGLQNAFKRLGWGCYMNDNAVYGAIVGFYTIYYDVIVGQPPAKPFWAQGPK